MHEAERFFKRCVAQADNQDRDVDLYHWSSAKFEATWRDTLSVLVARGRAQECTRLNRIGLGAS